MNVFKIFALFALCVGFSNSTLAQGSGQSGHAMNAESHAGMQGDAKASKAPFDQQFLDTMPMHHKHGVQMAQLVDSRSSSDKLKALAKKMIDDQQKESQQMQDMKNKWYPGAEDAMNMSMPGMKGTMQGMGEKMQKLESAKGVAFDNMFVDMMSEHHRSAIKMGQYAQSKVGHQEVKQMIKKMSGQQQKEIAQMSAMKKEWASSTK